MARKPMVNAFQLPNIVVDSMISNISGNALKCFLVVARKTTGWDKESDRIALSQLTTITGMGRRTIQRAMTELIDANLVRRVRSQGTLSEYSVINYDVETSDNPDTGTSDKSDTTTPEVVPDMTPGSVKSDTRGSDKSDTLQKTLYTKETITKWCGLVSDHWNKVAGPLGKPTLEKWTDERIEFLKERFEDDPKRDAIWWCRIIDNVPYNDIALRHAWFTLDWLLKSETNLVKFLEGHYKSPPTMDAPTNKGAGPGLDPKTSWMPESDRIQYERLKVRLKNLNAMAARYPKLTLGHFVLDPNQPVSVSGELLANHEYKLQQYQMANPEGNS